MTSPAPLPAPRRPALAAALASARQRGVALSRGIRLLVKGLRRHDAFVAASAIAFDAFLSVMPILAMLGYLVHRTSEVGGLLIEPLLNAAPPPIREIAGLEFLRLSERGAAALAPISAAGFLWLSSAGLSTAMGVFERMFGAAPRRWVHRRAIALVCVLFVLSALLLVGAALVFVIELLGPFAAAVLGLLLPPLVVIATLSAFYRLSVRRPRGTRRRAIPGALLTLVLWALLSAGFSLYVSDFERFSTFYGSLAAVAVFLIWLWLLAIALLVGGEVNAILEGARDPAATPLPEA